MDGLLKFGKFFIFNFQFCNQEMDFYFKKIKIWTLSDAISIFYKNLHSYKIFFKKFKLSSKFRYFPTLYPLKKPIVKKNAHGLNWNPWECSIWTKKKKKFKVRKILLIRKPSENIKIKIFSMSISPPSWKEKDFLRFRSQSESSKEKRKRGEEKMSQ